MLRQRTWRILGVADIAAALSLLGCTLAFHGWSWLIPIQVFCALAGVAFIFVVAPIADRLQPLTLSPRLTAGAFLLLSQN